jgi:hypothetical protein
MRACLTIGLAVVFAQSGKTIHENTRKRFALFSGWSFWQWACATLRLDVVIFG